jgi:hypothetical protein
MSCYGCLKNESFNGYNGYTPGPTQKLSHGSCEGVTIDLLRMWQRLFGCVENHSLYTQVKITEAELGAGKILLNSWIAAKELDPASCEHQEKLPLIQVLINRIVAYGQC